MAQQTTETRAAPPRKPILATMPGPDPLWNQYVEDYLPEHAGTLRDHLEMLRLSRGRQVLILNGSVGLFHFTSSAASNSLGVWASAAPASQHSATSATTSFFTAVLRYCSLCLSHIFASCWLNIGASPESI